MQTTKQFVYILQSTVNQSRYYTGLATDVRARLAFHNAGQCRYTAEFAPWTVVAAIEFAHESSAILFEKYLKSGSGRAFAKRHFV
jgi:predicted GIY-YIG superfamily endonuclease